MSIFDKYLQYRAMDFAFSISGYNNSLDFLSDEQLKELDEQAEMKFVNVPFPKPVVERLESTLSQLGMSKRVFVQRAVIDALIKAENAIEQQIGEIVEVREPVEDEK